MIYRVKVFCLGMMSTPREFDTEEAAEAYAADMRRIPGMVPLIEAVEK